MTQPDNFSHAATVLPVQDMQASIRFYTHSLPFELSFSWGEPVSYAVLKKGGVSIHLTQRADDREPSSEHCALYIFVYDIDQIYQHCVEQKVNIINPLSERDYEMRDFDIADPDGHIISFGKGG